MRTLILLLSIYIYLIKATPVNRTTSQKFIDVKDVEEMFETLKEFKDSKNLVQNYIHQDFLYIDCQKHRFNRKQFVDQRFLFNNKKNLKIHRVLHHDSTFGNIYDNYFVVVNFDVIYQSVEMRLLRNSDGLVLYYVFEYNCRDFAKEKGKSNDIEMKDLRKMNQN
ncbi:unnamed protein product [Caenorhabditis angaria]|uniref:Nuclear transport factor 2 family protein n=1 Tax=Caenorhabditis angaria TaxID=860376 RepID=A0A9P1N650_9PELO|nr:unnamed protein product [Caenorhabditis angaria]